MITNKQNKKNVSTSLDRDEYITLLSKMIACTDKLQNKPPKLIPNEQLIADIVMNELKECDHISIELKTHVESRPNMIIKYTNFSKKFDGKKSMGFVGSHMDVVPANPKEWKYNPFELTVDKHDPDILWGRGTTDCLGHVAMLTLLLKNLSKNKIQLDYLLGVVFIADEEDGKDINIGITKLENDGHLDFLKNGPVYWVDVSDTYPTVGTGTGMSWELTVTGKRGHSGMPHNAINPIIPAMDAVSEMLKIFKQHFPKHEKDNIYKYQCSSNMKPTQIKETVGSINQITESVTIQGDVRLTPFYDWKHVHKVMNSYIENINNDPSKLPSHHECFHNELNDVMKSKIKFELKWLGNPFVGIACDMESDGFKLLAKATEKVKGDMRVTSITGSLPLIANLYASGMDMQMIGYGCGEVYHANNEYCRFSGMSDGYDIIKYIITNYSNNS